MASYDDYIETNVGEDEYDDLDDFIVGSDDGDDAAGGEEEEEEEEEGGDLPEAEEEEEAQVEEEEPPAGVQEILSIREQLKAKFRKQYQSNGAGAGKTSCSPSVQAPEARSRFGTFFGPSTPALAPRLIEAGSSSIMREIQNVPSRRDAVLSASKSHPNASAHEQKPKIVPQVKRKVDALRENRDYSNLFSDDADAPPPAKEPPEKKPVVSPKSDVKVPGKPMQQPAGKNKVHTGQPARAPKDHRYVQGHVQSKVGSQVKKTLPQPNRRKTNPSVGNGSRPSNDIKKAPGVRPSSNGQNLQRPMQSKRPQASPPVHKQQQPSQTQRPPQVPRHPNHAPPSSQVRRVDSSVQSQQKPAQKGSSALSQDTRKLGQKQLPPSSKPKASVYNDRAKKTGGVKRKLSEAERVRQMVRDVLNYNPEKYAGRDEDDRNMEAGYASIQMEERRSAKLARKEDDEQLLMIQEEERRERANKKKKQRAQS